MSKDIKVFISYAHSDDPKHILCDQLQYELLGDRVWFDRGLTGGKNWQDGLVDEIRKCDIFLFFLSPAWLDSIPCQKELDIAIKEQKKLLPIEIDQVQTDVTIIPEQIKPLHWISARGREATGKFTTSTIVSIVKALADIRSKRVHSAFARVTQNITDWISISKQKVNITQSDTLEVAPFEIMTFPIINKHFSTFLNNEYKNRIWWHYSDKAYESRLKSRKPDIILQDNNIANVNWFDAVAYSRWYSSNYSENYRLPTYAELLSAYVENDQRFSFLQDKKEWVSSSLQHHNSYQLDDSKIGVVGLLSPTQKLTYDQIEKDYSSTDMTFRLVKKV